LKEEEWEVFLHREGFYDFCLKVLSYLYKEIFKDHNETIAEFRKHKEKRNWTTIFMPLEQEFYRHHINKEILNRILLYSRNHP